MSPEDAGPRGPIVLYRRRETILADVGGFIFSLTLGAVQTEWLPALVEGISAAHERARARLPLLAIFRLDKRYPLDIGFDANLTELRGALGQLRPTLAAVAVVTEFDGFLGATMRVSLRAIGAVTRARPPVAPHRSTVEGLRWLEPYLPEHHRDADAGGRHLAIVQTLGEALGSYTAAEAPRGATSRQA